MSTQFTSIALATALLGLALASCGTTPVASADDPPVETGASAAEPRATAAAADDDIAADTATTPVSSADVTPTPLVAPGAVLTDAEIEGLVFMREEEKLARDVYLTLFDLWDLRVFESIAAAETKHTGAVLGLLEAYGIDDPVIDDTIGVFVNPDLAALYVSLVDTGSESIEAALTVGATIEDLDIFDLRNWLDQTSNPDIERIYANLLAGSENHMRAFVGQLESRGDGYEAIYLTRTDIDAILASSNGRSGSGGNGRNH